MRSLGSRIVGTVFAGVGWLVFVILFVAFFAGDFDFWQNLAIFISSAVVALGVVAALWIEWAFG